MDYDSTKLQDRAALMVHNHILWHASARCSSFLETDNVIISKLNDPVPVDL